MAINIRKAGDLPDGSVTAAKLADSAVDLSSIKVTGQISSDQLADGAVLEQKLADLAISTAKLKDNVVTLAKASDDVKLNSFIGDETEVSVAGTTEQDVKEFNVPKVSGKFVPTKIRVLASLKTNDALYTATLKVYVNSDVTPILTLTSTSVTYELAAGEADISALADNQKHLIRVALVSDNVAGVAYNDSIDVMLVA